MKKMNETEMMNTNGGAKYTATARCQFCNKKFSATCSSWASIIAKVYAKEIVAVKKRDHEWQCIH